MTSRNRGADNKDARGVDDNMQRDKDTGNPVDIAPNGAKTEGEIEADVTSHEDDAARIDPDSRIPRPVQPDLA